VQTGTGILENGYYDNIINAHRECDFVRVQYNSPELVFLCIQGESSLLIFSQKFADSFVMYLL
jgi:hypothetical protein